MDILSLEMTRSKYMQFLECFYNDCRSKDDKRKPKKNYSYTWRSESMVGSETEGILKPRNRPSYFPSTSTPEKEIHVLEDIADDSQNNAISQELVQSLSKYLPLNKKNTQIIETILSDRTEPHSVAVLEIFLAQQIQQVRFGDGLPTFDGMNQILRHLFTDSSLGQYNWIGIGGKTSIQTSSLYMIIRDHTCKGHPVHFHQAILHCRKLFYRRNYAYTKKKKRFDP